MLSYSEEDTKKRFGVKKAIKALPSNLSPKEERYIKTVLGYMDVHAYSPDRSSADAVKPFCASNDTFSAPSTFPTSHTAEEYAESHGKVMSALTDLHIKWFDVVIAKEGFVSLRYTATGTHQGSDHSGIKATGRNAEWTAQGSFIIDEESGKIKHWWKDWDKMRMWKGPWWVKPDNDSVEFA